MVTFSLYLVIAIVCAIFLFIVLFLGDFDFGDADVDIDVDADVDVDVDHDAGFGHGPSAFSLPVLLSVFTAFGSFGVIFENLGYDEMMTPGLAVVGAIFVGFIVYASIWKMFKMAESHRKLNLRDLVGYKGTVSVSIKDGDQGQVLLTPPEHGRVLVGAIADEDIQRDETVRVIDMVGDVMKVKRIGPARKKKERSVGKKRKKEVK